MLMRSQTVEDKNKNTQQMRQTKVEHNQFSNILSIWLIFSQSLSGDEGFYYEEDSFRYRKWYY